MKSYTPSVRTFARSIEDEVRASQQQGSSCALIVLSILSCIPTNHREKLFDWGTLVACNHAPRGVSVCRWEAETACLLLLPRTSESEAAAIALTFVEQLNKLPVGGVAPGLGWRSESAAYPDNRVWFEELLGRLKRGLLARARL